MLKRLKDFLTLWDRDTRFPHIVGSRHASKRQHLRWLVELSALLEFDGTTYYCTIKDITPRGAGILLVQDTMLAEGMEITLEIEGYGAVPARVRHADSGVVRIMFLHGEDGEEGLARWLLWLKPQRQQTRYACQIEASLRLLHRDYPCTVINLSRNGAAITMSDTSHLVISSEVEVDLPDYGSIAASVQRIDGDTVGLVLIDDYLGKLPPEIPSANVDGPPRLGNFNHEHKSEDAIRA